MIELLFFVDGILYNTAGLLLVALGILVLIRHTGFPDLTVDGSFTIGAAFFALTFSEGNSFFFAFTVALLSGAAAGLLTAFTNQVLGISKVVASVLSMTILILSAPYITGGATIGLLHPHGIQEAIQNIDERISNLLGGNHVYFHFATTLFWLTCALILGIVLFFFLSSKIGTALRYIGSAENPAFVGGHAARKLTLAGLMIGNALIAAGGAIEALRRGAYTANMGIGTLLLGLTIVILGEALIKTVKQRDFLTLHEQIIAILSGLIVYCTLLQLILSLGLNFVDLKLATTLLLLVLLGLAGRYFPNSKRLF